MIIGLVWILGVYAAGLILVHLCYLRRRKLGKERITHYVLLTYNNQLQVEWYIRSLQFFSLLRGRSILITVVDEGSEDDTLPIVQQLAEEHALYLVHASGWNWDDWIFRHEDEEVVVVSLRHNESLETAYKYL